MRYGSVCSGIEAASAAWGVLGWEADFVSEIEAFPSAVLAHHYPDVPNHGDMTAFKDWPDHAIDLLVGGTPCQSFSVAGLRAGLADPRGSLMLTYLAIAARYRPRWVVWENVPGVLSSNGGRDFGTFLGGLGELGYGFAYRVLDAQFCRASGFPHAVPQRRRRVFVVGYLGDWRRAAAVLFDGSSLRGDPTPRRQAGQGLAADVVSSLTASGRGVERTGETRGQDPVVAQAVSPTLNAAFGSKLGLENQHIDGGAGMFVAHALRGEGFDASEDGTGRGTPLIPTIAGTMKAVANSGGWTNSVDHAAAGYMVPISFGGQMSVPQVDFGVNQTLQAKNPMAIAFQSSQSGVRVDDVHATLDSNNGSRRHNGVIKDWAVRRLTPTECERLQGFPDNYTAVPYRKKPAADGPRYKALGNSMAVNVMRVLGERIALVDRAA